MTNDLVSVFLQRMQNNVKSMKCPANTNIRPPRSCNKDEHNGRTKKEDSEQPAYLLWSRLKARKCYG